MARIEFRYGRMLADFEVGATYAHPWEVTLDDGMVALWAASFQDATPLYSSSVRARELGFKTRPVPPLLCLNLALSFSVSDVSEQAIAHLAYVAVRFPNAAFTGDTVRARSTVLDVKSASSGDRGVVTVRTVLSTVNGDVERIICAFERKALVRAGQLGSRPAASDVTEAVAAENDDLRASVSTLDPLPQELRATILLPGPRPSRSPALHGAFEDFHVGDVYAHAIGRTVGESEHMQLTTLVRNSHPLHFDELYCKDGSFTHQRVVYGGLVFAWVAALSSRDLAGHALWDLGWDGGAHPSSVAAGDTIYAASRVEKIEDAANGTAGRVTLATVGVRNTTSQNAIDRWGDALFDPELAKKDGRVPEKVFEARRTLLVAKRV